MSNRVRAIVVSHDAPEYLKASLDALRAQSHPVASIVVVDSSRDRGSVEALTRGPEIGFVEVEHGSSLQQSVAAGVAAATEPFEWIWLIHDDSAPAPDALQILIDTIERSPSVAVLGPKQLDWQNSRLISQQGLTLTPGGALFSWVANELDQSQHDDMDDVLAVGTAAALIRLSVWQELGGFDEAAPPLAADVDFSIRVRLAGHRVAVVPAAKVRHAALSIRGERQHGWQSSKKTALRRAEIHLRLAYLPLPYALLYWLFLPWIGFGLSALRIAQKRPNRIVAELSAALWGFFTLGARLRSRSKTAGLSGGRSIKRFASLRASRAEVREARSYRAAVETAVDESTAADGFAAVVAGAQPSERASADFAASGGIWWFALLALFSIAYFPTDAALSGGSLLPLSSDWFEVFRRAGASWQPISNGFFGPADPLGWLLAALASVTFWFPNLALMLLWFLAKPLAFAGAWRLAAGFSRHGWVRTSAALAYALFPALAIAQAEGSLGGLFAAVALPWLAAELLAIAGVSVTARQSSQSLWSRVGVAGLLTAGITAAAPSIAPLIVVLVVVLALVKLRRLGYLMWVGLPLAAVFVPLAFFATANLGHPALVLADPGVATNSPDLIALVTANSGLWIISLAPLALLSVFALLSSRWLSSLLGWLLAIVATATAWTLGLLDFADGSSPSRLPLLALAGLGLTIAALAMLETLAEFDPKARRGRRPMHYVLAATAVLAPLSLSLFAPLDSSLRFTDGAVQPSIVSAQAAHGEQLRTLELSVLKPAADQTARFSVQLQNPRGVHLEDLSVAYRFAAAQGVSGDAADADRLVELTANLASANGISVIKELRTLGIGYILVPPAASDPQLAAATADLTYSLNSSPELEWSGESRFGQLWAVIDATPAATAVEGDDIWSITKGVQLAVILGFVLLAVPTSRRRVRAADSAIFDNSIEEVGIGENGGDRA